MKLPHGIKWGFELLVSLLLLIGFSSAVCATPDQDLARAFAQLEVPLSLTETPQVDWQLLESALQNGADPNARLGDGTPVLHLVALSGNSKLFKLMLAKGAQLGPKQVPAGQAPLMFYALRGGNSETVSLLLERGFAARQAEKTDGLIFSAFSGHLPLVELWLERGVPVDATAGAVFTEGATPLMMAAAREKSNMPVIRYLISQGARPELLDQRGGNILHWAAHSGLSEHMAFFLKYVDRVNQQDIGGYTPLMLAAMHDSTEVLELLLEKGADLNLRNEDGETALLLSGMAALGQPSEIFRFLIEAGSDVNATARDGMTPLLYSIALRDLDSFKLLLAKGARTDCQTPDGESALQLAMRRKSPEMIRLLKQAGAK